MLENKQISLEKELSDYKVISRLFYLIRTLII